MDLAQLLKEIWLTSREQILRQIARGEVHGIRRSIIKQTMANNIRVREDLLWLSLNNLVIVPDDPQMSYRLTRKGQQVLTRLISRITLEQYSFVPYETNRLFHVFLTTKPEELLELADNTVVLFSKLSSNTELRDKQLAFLREILWFYLLNRITKLILYYPGDEESFHQETNREFSFIGFLEFCSYDDIPRILDELDLKHGPYPVNISQTVTV